MGNVNERHNGIGDDGLSPAKAPDVGIGEIPVIPPGPVIELGDLTTGPEADVSQLKSNLRTLREEVKQIRGQYAGLASQYQKLTGELRDIKLVLAKAHAK